MRPTKQAVRDLAEEFGYSVATLKPDFRGEEGEPEWTGGRDYRNGKRRAFLCVKKTDISRLSVEAEPESPRTRTVPGAWKRSGQRPSGSFSKRDRMKAEKLEDWMRQTDLAVSELVASRRWRLASALDNAVRRVLGRNRGPTPEDRLLAIKDEFRAWVDEPARNPEKKSANSSAEKPKH